MGEGRTKKETQVEAKSAQTQRVSKGAKEQIMFHNPSH
jgi:hypothetical protein